MEREVGILDIDVTKPERDVGPAASGVAEIRRQDGERISRAECLDRDI
jgi:hypothetical protein